jgi:hypothetical protein
MADEIPARGSWDKEDERLDSLFVSQDPRILASFYEAFATPGDLIRWMRARPKGRVEIIEDPGGGDVVAVIPTVSNAGALTQRLRKEVFTGIRMVVAESGKNPYFNYAASVNAGVARALESNPKWIVVSNDDMSLIDQPQVLVRELSSLDDSSVDIAFTTPPGSYHSYHARVGSPRRLRNMMWYLIDRYHRTRARLDGKLRTRLATKIYPYMDAFPYNFIYKENTADRCRFINPGSFAIYSAKLVKELRQPLLDDTYINGWEDADLGIRLSRRHSRTGFVRYRIGDSLGASLGPFSSARTLREIANAVYFNYKLRNGDL